MKPGIIVAVDDQVEVRRLLAEIVESRGRRLVGFAAAAAAVAYLGEHAAEVELVILDLDLGAGALGGIDVCRELHLAHPELPIIILTGSASIDAAVEAMRAGAADFVTKDPWLEDKLALSVEKVERLLAKVRAVRRLEGENRVLRSANERLAALAGQRWQVVGRSKRLVDVLAKVERVAPVPRPVLILGERGTGKELVARAIHQLSRRATEPYVTINCAAVAESLLESELFGHEEGAFTGATRQKPGKFELADGGTLFLDEIGNMSLEFQAKILRILEYQRFERVAGSESIQVDVRVIAATNTDLEAAMARGAFRRDLYDRVAFETIELPALRDRPGDVAILAAHFLDRFRDEVAGVEVRDIAPAAIAPPLSAHDFPGNVRELKNVVERAIYAARGPRLEVADVEAALPRPPPAASGAPPWDDQARPLEARVEAFEAHACQQALERCRFNQREAAALLGLTYDQFRQRKRKYRLPRSE